jgi:hypothetical protein
MWKRFWAGARVPVLALTIGITAIAALTPTVMKFAGMLETGTDRTIKALSKLADEAERTGRAVTPEQFLAAFETEQKKTEQKATTASATTQIKASLKGFSGVDDSTIKTIFTSLSASGNIDKGGSINKEALDKIIKDSTTTRMTGTVLPTLGADAGAYGVYAQKYIGKESVLEQGRDMVLKNRAANLTNVEQVAKSQNALTAENAILDLGLKIRKNIFDAEMQIGREQAKRAVVSREDITLLERQKGILTEQAYAQEQYNLEVKKARGERAGARESTDVDLMKSLQGVTDNKLGNVLGQLSKTQTSSILSQFEQGGYKSEEFKKTFKEQTDVDFDALESGSRDSVIKSLETAGQANQSSNQEFNQAEWEAAQKFSAKV